MKFYLLLTLAILLFSINAFAQKKEVVVEATFTGAAQPKGIKLPLPIYSSDAKRKGLKGTVLVLVKVSETGDVSYAGYSEGPYPVCPTVTDPTVVAFRLAAESAAKKAKFKPAIVDGKPVSATGLMTYSFLLPEPRSGGKMKGTRLDRITKLGSADETIGARVIPTQDLSTDSSNAGAWSRGVLNGKAQELPKPTYPRSAKAVHAGGAVGVQVLISEDGSIYSAEAVSGHPLLKNAAEVAACKAHFMPTLLSGKPVKVSGIITYNFVP